MHPKSDLHRSSISSELSLQPADLPCMGGNILDLQWSKANLKRLSERKSEQNLNKLQDVWSLIFAI